MQIQDTLRELFWNAPSVAALPKLAISLAIAALLGTILAQVYIHFGQSLSNRRLFARNFLVLVVTTTLIISIVRSSLALSLGLVGALSIVRFRAAIKEPEELAFLFLAISIGLGLGAGQALITIVALVIILGLISIRALFRSSPGQPNLYLTVSSPATAKLRADQILKALAGVGASASLTRFDQTPEQLEAAFLVDFKEVAHLEQFTDRLRELSPDARVSCLDDRGLFDLSAETHFAMAPVLPNLRYERKFIPDGLVLAELLALVRRHPAAFREAYPPRFVNNIYLDSQSRSDYHDHIVGLANRSKTRVRWYGPPSGPIPKPVLERKLKRGLVSGKVTHALPGLALNGGALQPLLDHAFDAAALPERLRSHLRQLEPALFNRYRRHYFVSSDRRFRLTVNTDLQFGHCATPAGARTTLRPLLSRLILELKFGPAEAESAERVTNLFPFRLARCSKYALGIEHVG